MSTFQIKLLAIFSMLSSHLEVFFFPENPFLFAFGRLAFPLFAWLIANGAVHTKNIYGYAKRLLIFAFVSQIPFMLPNGLLNPDYAKLNVFFTLFVGLCAIIAVQKVNNVFLKIISIVLLISTAEFLNSDYGGRGVLAVVLFYIFFEHKLLTIVSQFFILAFIPLTNLFFFVSGGNTLNINSFAYLLPFAYISSFVTFIYNQTKGPSLKYWFYLFYPLHYVLIYVALLVIN